MQALWYIISLYMNQVSIANVISFVSALFVLGGVTGVTAQDISGTVNTLFGLITLASIVWSHLAHKAIVAAN